MTIPVRLEARPEALPIRHLGDLSATERPFEAPAKLSRAELAFRIFAAFRAHPHINNVLIHIARANLVQVERSLNRILDQATASDLLFPLEQNMVDLMCAERGITGKILKPYFHATLHRILAPRDAERLIRHVENLFLELEWKAQHPAPPSTVPSEPTEESGRARREPQ
jgi:hypothetical protein